MKRIFCVAIIFATSFLNVNASESELPLLKRSPRMMQLHPEEAPKKRSVSPTVDRVKRQTAGNDVFNRQVNNGEAKIIKDFGYRTSEYEGK